MPDKIYISEFDLKRLKELIKVAEEFGDKRVVRYLEELEDELDRAESMKPQEIPHNVITMNSTFRLRNVETDEETVYTLVFPGEADSARGKISVLAPIGTAVLGYKIGYDRVGCAGRTQTLQSRRDRVSAGSGGGLSQVV